MKSIYLFFLCALIIVSAYCSNKYDPTQPFYIEFVDSEPGHDHLVLLKDYVDFASSHENEVPRVIYATLMETTYEKSSATIPAIPLHEVPGIVSFDFYRFFHITITMIYQVPGQTFRRGMLSLGSRKISIM